MISPRPALCSGFLAFRAGASSSPTATSPPPSPRLHAPPPPLSASFSPSAVAATDRAACSSSFYDVLGLRPGAGARDIKAAYRRLARTVHPDAAAPHSSSAEDFIRVHAAYSTLSDPDKRADYDRRLLLSSSSFSSGRPEFGRWPSFPARRRLARTVHPDAAAPHSSSAEDFIRVHAAYSTLSDPDKRADYDRRLLLSSFSSGRPEFGRSPSFPARRRRTWETDQCW